MAWMNQERKAALAARLKRVLPEGWKYSLAVPRERRPPPARAGRWRMLIGRLEPIARTGMSTDGR
jgi:hypothetical protein